MSRTIWRCRECDSDQIEELVWVKMNTQKPSSEGPGDYWCPECCEHVKPKEEFVPDEEDLEDES